MFSKLFGSKPTQPSFLSRSHYADHYAAFIAQRMPDVEITRKQDDLHIAWSDGATMDLFLSNAYADYKNNPAALPAICEAAFASIVQAREGSEAFDPALLLPVLKTRSWRETSLSQIRQQEGSDLAPIVHPLTGDLLLSYALDLPQSIDYVKPKDLPEGWDEDALRTHAFANLVERAPTLEFVGGEGRYRVEFDGFFDTSFALIAPTWLDRIEIVGEPVFALPSRDQLMICGSEDPDAIASLAEIAPRIAHDSSYPLSSGLYLFRDGKLHAIDGSS